MPFDPFAHLFDEPECFGDDESAYCEVCAETVAECLCDDDFAGDWEE